MSPVWYLNVYGIEHGNPDDVTWPFITSIVFLNLPLSPIENEDETNGPAEESLAGLRGWMTRDFDAVANIIESQSPEVARVEEKLGSIVTRLQKAEDLQMEIEKRLNNDN